MRRLVLLFAIWTSGGCVRSEPQAETGTKPAKQAGSVAKPASEKKAAPAPIAKIEAAAAVTKPAPAPSPDAYPWLADAKPDLPKVHDTLLARFAPPKGFERVEVTEGSFGAWLRALPLAPPGTPVLTHTGKVLHDASHPNVAAVVAIDVGKGDLQQCADSVIRLHAEWLWSKGRRDQRYRAASGLDMQFAKYAAGERLSLVDGKLVSKKIASPSTSHGAFRGWLDEVFGWANTGSLQKQAKPVALADLAPGDFVVMTGVPFGHAVVVLDVAVAQGGRRVLLLGQGYMPAQSFHVLRSSKGEVWFPLDEASGQLATPFWEPFPFDTLRRLGD